MAEEKTLFIVLLIAWIKMTRWTPKWELNVNTFNINLGEDRLYETWNCAKRELLRKQAYCKTQPGEMRKLFLSEIDLNYEDRSVEGGQVTVEWTAQDHICPGSAINHVELAFI